MSHYCVEGVTVERHAGGAVDVTIDGARVELAREQAMDMAFEMLGWTLVKDGEDK